MNKLLVICGPTATGKTGLGIRLAKECSGEIISADSRQVYRGMDIGTGKDIAGGVWRSVRKGKEQDSEGYWEVEGIPIYLLDLAEPSQEFSVAHFYRLAWREIKRLWQRGKLPILVGGTGLYIKGVVDGINTKDIPRNLAVRAEVKEWSVEKLFGQLAKFDSEKAAVMNRSDRYNPRRLVRAIEIAIFKQEHPNWQPPGHFESDHLFVGLKAPREILDQRIEERVEERLKQGIEEEIKELLEKGYTWQASALGDTLAYQEWQPFFEEEATREEVIERWKTDECQYARRQMTWFRGNKRINWFDISQKEWENEIEELVREWYHGKDA